MLHAPSLTFESDFEIKLKAPGVFCNQVPLLPGAIFILSNEMQVSVATKYCENSTNFPGNFSCSKYSFY